MNLLDVNEGWVTATAEEADGVFSGGAGVCRVLRSLIRYTLLLEP